MTIADLWDAFWRWTEVHRTGAYLFRGQAEDIPIRPKIGRVEYGYALPKERQMFDAFKRAARPFVQIMLGSAFEWLALAQHHGLPTRLADWSTSPLVAAWFAVASFPLAGDAVIYGLDLLRKDVEPFDLSTNRGVRSNQGFDGPPEMREHVYLIESPRCPPALRRSEASSLCTARRRSHCRSRRKTASSFLNPLGSIFRNDCGLGDRCVPHISRPRWAVQGARLASPNRQAFLGDCVMEMAMSRAEHSGSDDADVLPWQRSEVVSDVGSAIAQELAQLGKEAVIKSVRFVPSTLSEQPNGVIQMVANTIVELKGVAPGRSEVFESVVTIDPVADPALQDVLTHSLERLKSARGAISGD